MKMVLTTATLLSIIATPVLAQSFDPDEGSGNLDFNWQGGKMYHPKYRSGHEPKGTIETKATTSRSLHIASAKKAAQRWAAESQGG